MVDRRQADGVPEQAVERRVDRARAGLARHAGGEGGDLRLRFGEQCGAARGIELVAGRREELAIERAESFDE
jgi:hypothetical protein